MPGRTTPMEMTDPILDPHRLLQFVAVAEHLNITHAAAEIGRAHV